MIGSLRGEVLERNPDGTVLIEVVGVGYLVTVSQRTMAELEPSTKAFLYVHHHIREDTQTLYGFVSREERGTFQVLIGTHGVGPALAMAVLATHPPLAIVDIVANNDVAAMSLVPGVGKKTAERLIVELRDRLSIPVLERAGGGGGSGQSSAVADVREALTGLGYGTDEVRDVLRDLSGDTDASSLLREALKSLGARRA
jgi:holliday junction DNA helicase RuvA